MVTMRSPAGCFTASGLGTRATAGADRKIFRSGSCFGATHAKQVVDAQIEFETWTLITAQRAQEMEKPNITIPLGRFPLLGPALHNETVVQRILLFV
jgi:hypothetical protein